ncbi:MAG TPA: orotate phosphoribosyltransferase [Burkholderiales bacterium]|jgi:orotate phosphoribosyltransferase|nr:orotate phosphoribosyltransferase [Burkholderiales bacterium]
MLFADKSFIADMTAKMMLEVKAVHFSQDKPFVFTSGWASPVYIDVRKLISYPRVRSAIIDFAAATIVRDVGFEQFDTVAGGETAGIPYAAWIADRLSLPMQYVRKKPKGFGRGAQIEGHIEEGARTLLVEDLTTDGRSKVNFCKALRDAGAIVDHVFVVFYYDIFPESKKIIADIQVKLLHLATWWDVLRVVKQGGYFESRVIEEVERFLHAPAKWSAEHGGVSAFPES